MKNKCIIKSNFSVSLNVTDLSLNEFNLIICLEEWMSKEQTDPKINSSQ